MPIPLPWGQSIPHDVPTTDLLGFPMTFTQSPLISPDEFIKKAGERGVRLRVEHLVELHRIKALVPMLRILHRPSKSAPPVAVAESARGYYREVGSPLAHAIEGAAEGHLIDPGLFPYRRWDSGITIPTFGGPRQYPSVFYSSYQLLGLRAYASLVDHMKSKPVGEEGRKFTFEPSLSPEEIAGLELGRRLATVLNALDARYLLQILLTVIHPDLWYEWDPSFDVSERLSHFGATPEHLTSSASALLSQARFFDPLEDWYELMREAHPSQWSKLKGDALLAMDYRIASEILLRAVDELGRDDLSTAPPRAGRMFRATLDDRLKPDAARIELALTSRGLYPVPAVLLVLEGKTETLLMPRVLQELFGRPVPATLVDVINMETIDRDLDLLVRREIAPRLGHDQGDFVWLSRPPTRMLIAVDPEKKYATKQLCEEQRLRLTRRIYESLEPQYQTATSQQEINHLVEIVTWGQHPWEFANFTDADLAAGIMSLVTLPEGMTKVDLVAALQAERKVTNRSPNVENVGKRMRRKVRKVELAEALWPRLQRKVQADGRRGRPFRTPATTVAARALELALTTHRRNVVLPVK